MYRPSSIFIAATGQHQGKTTISLGLLSLLRQKMAKVGFMKPVGQELSHLKGHDIDKDAVLFSNLFHLEDDPTLMSPLCVDKHFTKDYLDGKIDTALLEKKILNAFYTLSERYSMLVVEGTGHMGVGSIFELNNAKVARLLNLKVILVTTGGLGSSLDNLALAHALCEKYGITISGVILNRVLPEKMEMVHHYMQKALSRWKIPLLGSLPLDPQLANPTMQDYAQLFHSELIAGEEFELRIFEHKRLVATSVENYIHLIRPRQLIITPATRSDVILATYRHFWEKSLLEPDTLFETGFILTGNLPPQPEIVALLKKAKIPTLYTPTNTFTAMQKIVSFTAKIHQNDHHKIEEAQNIVSSFIDADRLMTLINS